MKNIDKIFLQISLVDFKMAAIFSFFDIKTDFLVCNPIFGSSMGPQKELDKKHFFLEILGGHICEAP